MRLLSCLTNSASVLIADTSAVINLNATRCASQILRALPNKLVVVDIVCAELNEGRDKGRQDAELTEQLVKEGILGLVTLGKIGLRHFEELTIGPANETLDDGEAATLAYALETGAVPIIDEKKATRICAARFANVAPASSVDILAHIDVQKALGQDVLATAAFTALQEARMRVLDHHLEWVVALIGQDRASQCVSLPRKVRNLKSVISA
jgi:predicted nucleic acid-binding protein